ncbi:MAG TPA: hypothetical protein VF857_11285, partial [Spirochaetota bacterium]
MPVWVVYVIIVVVIVAIVIAFRIFRKKMTKRAADQKAVVNQHKVTTTVFVIDKKKGKIADARLPKQVVDQIPAIYKIRKLPLVTAKVGPQIVTLICEEDVFKKLPEKKNVRVDLAGIFIVAIN